MKKLSMKMERKYRERKLSNNKSTKVKSTSTKLAVQCLNDPESFRDCALYQVQWRKRPFLSPRSPLAVSVKNKQ